MKKRPIAFYALTAALAVGTGSVLAQHSTGDDYDLDNNDTQSSQDATQSSTMTTPGSKPTPGTKPMPGSKPTPGSTSTAGTIPADQSSQRAKDVVSNTPAADRANKPDYTSTRSKDYVESKGYMHTAPVNGMQASDLIGAEVQTTGGENVGPVDDLIIDENGQVVAIVIGVGGFLNMGEKDVAIGWDDVTRSGDADDQKLTIDMTRDDLRPAPAYAQQD